MLYGKKVILDVILPDDLEWMRRQRNNPELRKYFREWKNISPDQQLEWYKERGNNSNPAHIYFRIGKATSAELVGCCNLSYIDWHLKSAEFGVFVAHEFRGQGLGKEALTLMFDYGFNEANLHKIWCEVFDNNVAVDFYRSLGFKDEGIKRDSYFQDGKYGNSYMMSVLENEWREIHGK